MKYTWDHIRLDILKKNREWPGTLLWDDQVLYVLACHSEAFHCTPQVYQVLFHDFPGPNFQNSWWISDMPVCDHLVGKVTNLDVCLKKFLPKIKFHGPSKPRQSKMKINDLQAFSRSVWTVTPLEWDYHPFHQHYS